MGVSGIGTSLGTVGTQYNFTKILRTDKPESRSFPCKALLYIITCRGAMSSDHRIPIRANVVCNF